VNFITSRNQGNYEEELILSLRLDSESNIVIERSLLYVKYRNSRALFNGRCIDYE
jgi:hypothetical protein